jgi:amino acid transporter
MTALRLSRLIFGSPLHNAAAEGELLSKRRALAIFSSDPLSSVAYATEEILIVLIVAGSATLWLSLPIAGVICALIAIVAASYYQTLYAYPSGGGAYAVARANLGRWPGLLAAASLLVDYVLTVAVSVSAGVRAITSAFPALLPYTVAVCLLIVVFLTLANLRGMRESAAIFALPTYVFVGSILLMIVVGLYRLASGTLTPGAEPGQLLPAESFEQLSLLLLLRAFSAGCTAMTGIEAISNGVPAFRTPKARNAAISLVIMAVLLASMFIGITVLAHQFTTVPSDDESVVSQIARGVFGDGALYLLVQGSTMLILVLAANTPFAGLPSLASILARDGFLPRQLANRGDRLAFSNGILALAGLASVLLVAFRGDTHALIPLYAVGVFLSFTLSQAGMVRHWWRERGERWVAKTWINGLGAMATGVALLVIVESKFLEGAWMIVLLIPVLLWLFGKIKRHYRATATQLSPRMGGLGEWLPWVAEFRPKVVVPVSRLHRGTLAALQFARALSDDVTAVIVDVDAKQTAQMQHHWRALRFKEELVVLESPYRSVVEPLIDYLETVDRRLPERGAAVVVLPEFLPARWWQNLLHNQSALLLKAALLFRRGPDGRNRIVVDVPYQLTG